MSGRKRVAATRANLLRARRRRERVSRGIGLLRRKREALVRELLHMASSAVDARDRVDERARDAYPALLEALAVEGREGLRATGWPSRDLRVRLRALRLWGVTAAEIEELPAIVRSLEARGTAPPLTSPASTDAATAFERLLEVLLEAAPREQLLRKLGRALSRTSRQLNALERRLDPMLRDRVRSIQRTLDQREREDHFRLRRLLSGRRRGVGQGEVSRTNLRTKPSQHGSASSSTRPPSPRETSAKENPKG